MAKIIMTGGIDYECPECGSDIELGQNYCQDCGEGIDWIEEDNRDLKEYVNGKIY